MLKLGSASGVGPEMLGFSTVRARGLNLGSASGVASEILVFCTVRTRVGNLGSASGVGKRIFEIFSVVLHTLSPSSSLVTWGRGAKGELDVE